MIYLDPPMAHAMSDAEQELMWDWIAEWAGSRWRKDVVTGGWRIFSIAAVPDGRGLTLLVERWVCEPDGNLRVVGGLPVREPILIYLPDWPEAHYPTTVRRAELMGYRLPSGSASIATTPSVFGDAGA